MTGHAAHAVVTDSAPTRKGGFRLPSVFVVFGAMMGFQLGTVLVKPAVEAIGPLDASFIRLVIGATLLLAWTRPNLAEVRANWKLLLMAGAGMAGTTVGMLAAIERIPVGIAVAIEFWGPMVLAVSGTRHRRDLLWVALAFGGILLFTPLADASFDSVGVLLAIASGACFGAMLAISARLGIAMGGVPAAGLSMAVAIIWLAPFSLSNGIGEGIDGNILLHLVLAALFTNCIGVGLEYTALTRIKPSLYAILICLEPALGALLAWLILDETIGRVGLLGMLLVSIAALGATRASNRAHL